MSERVCVFAWTAPCGRASDHCPEHLNISVVDGKCEVTVRGPHSTATITLPRDQLVELINMPYRALHLTR